MQRTLHHFSGNNFFKQIEKRLKSNCLSLLLISIVLLCSHISTQASLIFSETWNSYSNDSSNFFLNDTATADETWYGARFESGNDLADDLVIRYTDVNIDDNYMRITDDAALLFNISTIGLTDVKLTYDWRTHELDSDDDLKVLYSINDGNGELTSAFADSNNADFVSIFGGHFESVDWRHDHFTNILTANDNGAWHSEEYMLPTNTESVWVAFFMDGSQGAYSKIDNINVTGTQIPEPISIALFGTGILALAAKRRKQ